MICRACRDDAPVEVMDLGRHALPGQFLRADEIGTESRLPLRLMFCPGCFAVQLDTAIPPHRLFGEYFYHSSAIASLRDHAGRYAADLLQRFSPDAVLEIGCNDGVMLRHFAGRAPRVVGVDPARSAVSQITDPRVRGVNAYFTEELAGELGTFDLIVANNVMAHIPDIANATRGIKAALTAGGVFVMECHHLGAMIAGLQYDWIYHEHLFYWSLLALSQHFARHGLMVFDVEPVDMHGGSMRVFVCHAGRRIASQRVDEWLARETADGLHDQTVFYRFAADAVKRREELARLVQAIVMAGKRVAGYGASGRANTILQWCGLTAKEVFCIADDSPVKQGRYTPGSHIPIVSRDEMNALRPDFVLVLAWPYLSKIAPNCGGRSLIVPLPEVSIVPTVKAAA